MTRTPGVGVCITDVEGRLLFVNDTAMVLFSDSSDVSYQGKKISDFHPPEFVAERLEMIRRVLEEGKPLSIRHIYHGRRIESTVWPIRDTVPPFNRAIVVSRTTSQDELLVSAAEEIECFSTEYIDLGPLNVLSKRELEVLALLGHGMSVPRAAEILHRSPKTVQQHKASISKKLRLKGQAELVAIVTAMGLDISDANLKRIH